MKQVGYLLVGNERLPYSLIAIESVGLHVGDRIASLDMFEALRMAEWAASKMADALYFAGVSAISGVLPSCE